MTSVRAFLLAGLLAGVLAGILAFGVAYVLGEPSVNASIAVEEAEDAHADPAPMPADDPAHDNPAHDTVVPRSLQSTLGLLTGTAVAGTLLGGFLGSLTALALGRFGGLGVRGTSLLLAGFGFVSCYLLPSLAYPPNPPAVGRPETIGYRTELYAIMLTISLISAVVAVLVGRRIAAIRGVWSAVLLAAAGYLVVTLAATALMPHYDEVPADFPAVVLFTFRRASLIIQLALWGSCGLILGALLRRTLRRAARPAESARQLHDVGV